MLFTGKLYKIVFSNSDKFSDIASGVVESERHPSGNNIVVQISECL